MKRIRYLATYFLGKVLEMFLQYNMSEILQKQLKIGDYTAVSYREANCLFVCPC